MLNVKEALFEPYGVVLQAGAVARWGRGTVGTARTTTHGGIKTFTPFDATKALYVVRPIAPPPL